ncbi:MAG: riboflavin synthase [Anaerovoracaceae bacterium]
MFTGIIEEVGTVRSVKISGQSAILEIQGSVVLCQLKLGDSIAVNGVCLTVTSFDSDCFTADIMHETMDKSSLKGLRMGHKVNLERAMASGGRFGGHIVSGHIDGVGRIVEITKDFNATWYGIKCSKEILRLVVLKGSITIDGISLTVAAVDNEQFKVSVIPHTMGETILSLKQVGDIVNLENDIIGKYVERLMNVGEANSQVSQSNLSVDFLRKNGF